MTVSRESLTRSIRDRLIQRARAGKLTFNQVFTLFALERLLFRIGASPYRRQFVLKGGLMMRASGAPLARPTRDADLEGFLDADPQVVAQVFREIVQVPCPADGLDFDPAVVSAEPIQLDTEYGGIRVNIPGTFGTARFALQVDLGFGDAITPAPVQLAYPVWLEQLPPPDLLGYPLETIVAEKYETLFRRREVNSRVRDWFDLWLLAKTRPFEGELLQRAITNTFAKRMRHFRGLDRLSSHRFCSKERDATRSPA